jgi:diaminobutyrate-2-oxoglutarate transaminase
VRRVVAAFEELGRQFCLLWIGETACDLGLILVQFGLSVWIYQKSGSAQQFAFVFLAGTIPVIVFAPVAAALADYFDRRRVIVLLDLAAIVLMSAVGVLLLLGHLTLHSLYVTSALSAWIASIRLPSYLAALIQAVPERSLTRANGLRNLSSSVLSLVGPLLAGGVMAAVGLAGALVISLVMMTAGLGAVYAALYHGARVELVPPAIVRPPLLKAFVMGMKPAIVFLRREPLMFGLLLYTVVHDGTLVLASTMLVPLVLAAHSSSTLGLVSSCGAIGGLIGALVPVVVNPRARLVSWLLISNVCVAVCVVVVGFTTSAVVWCVCASLALLAGSVAGACSMALWMRKTPLSRLGGIASLLNMTHAAVAAAVVTFGGIVNDRLLEPALSKGGAWENTLGLWVGSGKGRGLGLLFIATGVLCAIVSLVALANSGMRRLDGPVRDAPKIVAQPLLTRTEE